MHLPSLIVNALVIATFGASSVTAAGEGASQPASRPVRFSDTGAREAGGFLVHTVQSCYQAGTTKLRVLLPAKLDPVRRYRVVYVLPVEAGDGRHFGDGLAEIRKLGLHDKHGLICVQPTFAQTPWYADHPIDPNCRQEAYLLKAIVPFVERTYPALAEPRGRLLLGFSKSGWGAWSLLRRHPDVFGRAAAWDAPLTKDRPDQWGMGEVFGTQENFLKYHVPTLLKARAGSLGGAPGEAPGAAPTSVGDDGGARPQTTRPWHPPRLALLGYGNFRDHHVTIHAQMLALGIAHLYRDGPKRPHHWASGWLAEAVEFLAVQEDP